MPPGVSETFRHPGGSRLERSSWAARQVAAAIPLLAQTDQDYAHGRIIQSGLVEAFRVLASIAQLSKLTKPNQQLKTYLLHPPTKGQPYPLGKAIVARIVLRGLLSKAGKRALRSALMKTISDPCYIQVISRRG